jgi:hypothetical protein
MHKDHRPLEVDVAAWARRYLAEGRDPGEILTAMGKAFPGLSYGSAARALAQVQGVQDARIR